jgi:hypothetical protein
MEEEQRSRENHAGTEAMGVSYERTAVREADNGQEGEKRQRHFVA